MADDFEYVSKTRLIYKNGARHAYLGEVPEPVVYGVQGALRQYYGAPEGPPVASTLDHIEELLRKRGTLRERSVSERISKLIFCCNQV